jgi:ribose/xylose/arabinose/galactoside ABC-type transport system permease subunit
MTTQGPLATVPDASAGQLGVRNAMRQLRQVSQVLLGLIIIYAGFSIVSAPFRSVDTLLTVLTQATILAVLACGTTVVLISGGLELSVGSIFAIVGVLAGQLIVTFHWPVWAAIAACLLVGTFCGLLNGIIQVTSKVPAFLSIQN